VALHPEVSIWSLDEVSLTYSRYFIGHLLLSHERLTLKLLVRIEVPQLIFVNRDMLNYRGTEHDVELIVLKRQPRVFSEQRSPEAVRLPTSLERFSINISDRHILSEADYAGEMRAVFRSQVKNPVGRFGLKQLVE